MGYETKKVLVVDSDPQGNTSSGLGMNGKDTEEAHLYHCYMGEADGGQVIKQVAEMKNLHLLPTRIDLIGVDITVTNSDNLCRELGDLKYRPHALLRKMLKAGHLGRKTGQGWHTYG